MADATVTAHGGGELQTVPLGTIVLVTGANGYIGAHVVDEALSHGYVVRGVTRSEEKGRGLKQYAQAKYGADRYEAVVVPDIEAEGAYDTVIKGVAGVIHVASPVTIQGSARQAIDAAVNGTLNILKAAKSEPSVRSVVITSSSVASVLPSFEKAQKADHTTWNDVTYDELAKQGFPDGNPAAAYYASKVRAERLAWKFYDEKKPQYKLNTLLPNVNLGRPLEYPGAQAATTSAWIYDIIKGSRSVIDNVRSQWYVHVRDNAKLHVRALADPSIRSERIWAAAAVFTWPEVLRILKELHPELTLPDDPKQTKPDLTVVDNKRGEALLGGWTSLKDTLKEMGTSFP
ncbi:aldehyde reductase [Gloeophyllum trabeum ATCC 11539]|uniref:Aldehyde reductase n=1 Tax=Gloeophyllum trabeum (strain ATCC 11539 / FP-39264 / Madison 617) TaxID=670483 RepID=S7PVY7_GLOTA|nr:aldehyde reductase [Gloeophyllum trabeum ATCC 11539]EPQ51678.1 aldehyde reductase [Gloeophyllum trabeum ATCC 11539]